MLLGHVDEVHDDVDGHHVGPLRAVVRRLVHAQQREHLAHDHRVRDVAVGGVAVRCEMMISGEELLGKVMSGLANKTEVGEKYAIERA